MDTSSGCPEVEASVALQLIQDYESLVGRKHIRKNKIKRKFLDLDPISDEALISLIRREGSEAEAALRLLLSGRFPHVPGDALEQLVRHGTEESEGSTPVPKDSSSTCSVVSHGMFLSNWQSATNWRMYR